MTKIIKQISFLDKENHEIGLHLHPDSDLALQNKFKTKFDYTSARFYKFNQIKGFLTASKNLIAENTAKELSKKIVSFRWGNWALDTNAVKALQETGFRIDSSAVPGIKGRAVARNTNKIAIKNKIYNLFFRKTPIDKRNSITGFINWVRAKKSAIAEITCPIEKYILGDAGSYEI